MVTRMLREDLNSLLATRGLKFSAKGVLLTTLLPIVQPRLWESESKCRIKAESGILFPFAPKRVETSNSFDNLI